MDSRPRAKECITQLKEPTNVIGIAFVVVVVVFFGHMKGALVLRPCSAFLRPNACVLRRALHSMAWHDGYISWKFMILKLSRRLKPVRALLRIADNREARPPIALLLHCTRARARTLVFFAYAILYIQSKEDRAREDAWTPTPRQSNLCCTIQSRRVSVNVCASQHNVPVAS